jgi:hypothetical protein
MSYSTTILHKKGVNMEKTIIEQIREKIDSMPFSVHQISMYHTKLGKFIVLDFLNGCAIYSMESNKGKVVINGSLKNMHHSLSDYFLEVKHKYIFSELHLSGLKLLKKIHL